MSQFTVGQQIGFWTVTGERAKGSDGRPVHECLCICGKRKTVRVNALRLGLRAEKMISCGCDGLGHRRAIALGDKIGRWTVVGEQRKGPDNRWAVDCVCECGTGRLVRIQKLRTGDGSCGCLTADMARTHGLDGTPTSKSYRAMKMRCLNSKHVAYSEYGGRGVTICARWLESFENFVEDMGIRPIGTTLDRIDNEKLENAYSKENCRWANPKQQQQNRRGLNFKLTASQVQEIHGRCEHGESQKSVAERFGINAATVSRIRSGRIYPEHRYGWP